MCEGAWVFDTCSETAISLGTGRLLDSAVEFLVCVGSGQLPDSDPLVLHLQISDRNFGVCRGD